MAKTKIYRYCYHCDGTGKNLIFVNGEQQEGDEDCKICDGKGEILWGYFKDSE